MLNDFLGLIVNNPLAGVLALPLSVWLAHRLTLGREALTRRSVAVGTIAAAFQSELTEIQQSNCDIGLDILTKTAFTKHNAVILDNIRALSLWQRRRLRRAWRELAYHKQDKGEQFPYYGQYCDGGSLIKRRAIRPLAIARLERIITSVS